MSEKIFVHFIPIQMISVTADKTLGYNIDFFFPYLKVKEPGTELNFLTFQSFLNEFVFD